MIYKFLSCTKAMLRISLPLILAYLGETAIGFTDNIMLGRLGADELGAAGLALSIYTIMNRVGASISSNNTFITSYWRRTITNHTKSNSTRVVDCWFFLFQLEL